MPNNRFDDLKTNTVDSFFLAHHGIKGQKWGVRRFQNPNGSLTPAGRERYLKNTKREKKGEEEKQTAKAKGKTYADKLAKYRVTTEGSDEKASTSGYILDNKLRLGQEYSVRDDIIQAMIKGAENDYKDRHSDYHYEEDDKRKDYRNRGLGSAAAEVGVSAAYGGVITATTAMPAAMALATPGVILGGATVVATGVRLHQGTTANKKLEKAIKEINSNTNVDSKTGLKLINGEHSEKDDMRMINLGYKNFSETTKNNCALCTACYDLRRRGYDVIASGNDMGINIATSMSWYKDTKLKVMDSNTSARAKYRELSEQPEGSRGNLTVRWANGEGGHSMAYEIKDGKPIVRDCQVNKVIKGMGLKSLFAQTGECRIMRTDNLEINPTEMKKYNVFFSGESSKESAKKVEKQLSHSSPSGITFDDILAAGASIEHWGTRGMHWGERKYQYMDGSLTPAGKERYLKGGNRDMKKELKAMKRREKILSDRKKLYKHRDEFSKEEIDEAMQRFASQDALKKQMDDEKQRQQKEKEQTAQAKFKYKQMKLQAKMDKQAAKEKQKQAELQTQQSEIATQQKQDTASLDTKAQLWKKRTEKLKTIVDFAKTGKTILDDMGITSKHSGESLFGAIAESLGIKDSSGKAKAEADKAARALETEKLNLEKLRWNVAQVKATAQKAMQGLKPDTEGGKDVNNQNGSEHKVSSKDWGKTPDDVRSSSPQFSRSDLRKNGKYASSVNPEDVVKKYRVDTAKSTTVPSTDWSSEMSSYTSNMKVRNAKKRKDGKFDQRYGFKGIKPSDYANVKMEELFAILNSRGIL